MGWRQNHLTFYQEKDILLISKNKKEENHNFFENKLKKPTSLKRIILGWRSDLWLIISRATFSSICNINKKLTINKWSKENWVIDFPANQELWKKIGIKIDGLSWNGTDGVCFTYLVSTLNILHGDEFLSFFMPQKPRNSKIPSS